MRNDEPRYDVIAAWPMAGWYVRDTMTLSAIGLPIVVRTFGAGREASARQLAGSLSVAHEAGQVSILSPAPRAPVGGV